MKAITEGLHPRRAQDQKRKKGTFVSKVFIDKK